MATPQTVKKVEVQPEAKLVQEPEVKPTQQTQQVKKATVLKIRPKHPITHMVHVLTGQRIEGEILIEEVDSFLQSQIEAGKLELC